MLFYQRRTPRAAPTTAPRAPPGVNVGEPLKRSKPLPKPQAGTRTPQHTVTPLGSQTGVYGVEEAGVEWPTQLRLTVHLPGVTSVTKVIRVHHYLPPPMLCCSPTLSSDQSVSLFGTLSTRKEEGLGPNPH